MKKLLIMVIACYGLNARAQSDSRRPSRFILLGLGTGFAIGGLAVQVSGYRKLENAVETYNR